MKAFLFIIATVTSIQAQIDWSPAFPEFVGCSRTISKAIQMGQAVEQSAEYKVGDRPCGSIVLRREPRLLETKRRLYTPWHEYYPSTWITFRGFDAFRGTPLCGVDEWQGTLEIFFENDKTLTVSSYRLGPSIMDFANTTDFRQLSRAMK
jgi:hypothetical protein